MNALWKHQQTALDKAANSEYHALFFDPGTGKTRTLIEILRHKFASNGMLLPTVILCPPVVIKNWQNEWLTYSKVKQEKIVLLTGTGKERLAKLNQVKNENLIVVTNYETLNMEPVFELLCSFLRHDVGSCLVLDESHRCKSMKAKRTKLALTLSQYAKYRYLLSGTPVLNSLEDIFSQWYILDQGKAFGGNYFSFRARFFYDKNHGMPHNKYFPDWRPRTGAEEEIKKIIDRNASFAKKSECLDLPPFVRKTIEVEMGPEQKRLYEAMKKDLIATIMGEDGKLRVSIAELAITKALRLQQIVSGHLRVEEGGETKTLTIKINPRKDALYELLEDLAPYHKVLVWSVFTDNYSDIRDVCASLKLGYVELHGETKDKEHAVGAINTDSNIRVLIGHPGSGGIGVNLTSASYAIFYSRSFSLEFDIQAEARNYRGGSERHESITRIDLVAPGTIDELVLKALASKQQLSDTILRQEMGNI